MNKVSANPWLRCWPKPRHGWPQRVFPPRRWTRNCWRFTCWRSAAGGCQALEMMGESFPAEHAGAFEAMIAARATRVPLQHLTGVAHFRYLELQVGPGVFVPRPETETVVQLAIDFAKGLQRPAAG